MTVDYIEVDEAIAMSGLRMVVVSGVPSPWGEAAKGIFHIKGIEWKAVRLVYDDPKLSSWAGELSGPVAIYNQAPPLSGWEEILHLAERLAPNPSLLPVEGADRELILKLSHELVGEGGLAWTRRLQKIHAGLTGEKGFPEKASKYLAMKYKYTPEAGAASTDLVVKQLGGFADRLKAQKAAGSDYYVGDDLTAADIYSATALAIFQPLPEGACALDPRTRAMFEACDEATAAALDPVLLAHRQMIYERHLELPLSL